MTMVVKASFIANDIPIVGNWANYGNLVPRLDTEKVWFVLRSPDDGDDRVFQTVASTGSSEVALFQPGLVQ